MRRVHAKAQNMQGAGRDLGADLHPGQPRDPVRATGLQKRPRAPHIVMVGQRHTLQTGSRPERYEFLRRIGTIGERRVQVEIQHGDQWQVYVWRAVSGAMAPKNCAIALS